MLDWINENYKNILSIGGGLIALAVIVRVAFYTIYGKRKW